MLTQKALRKQGETGEERRRLAVVSVGVSNGEATPSPLATENQEGGEGYGHCFLAREEGPHGCGTRLGCRSGGGYHLVRRGHIHRGSLTTGNAEHHEAALRRRGRPTGRDLHADQLPRYGGQDHDLW